jgi:hypothetical protein
MPNILSQAWACCRNFHPHSSLNSNRGRWHLVAGLAVLLSGPGCRPQPTDSSVPAATPPSSAGNLAANNRAASGTGADPGLPVNPHGTANLSASPIPSDPFEASHQRMLATLRDVDKQSKEDHPFLGLRPLRMAELAVRTSGPSLPAWDRSVMLGIYGQELLRSGRTKEAVAQMKASMELVESLGDSVPTDVRQQIHYLFGVAYLRDAETVNCVHCINGERCLFPIAGEGVHEDPASSRAAVAQFEKALELDPEDVKARWLLNIAHMTLGQYPEQVPPRYRIDPASFAGAESPVGAFVNRSAELKMNVRGCAGSVIVDDFDGDGDLDVIFSSWETDASLVYFRNQGDGTFINATQEANLVGITGGLNLIQADYDNDGDLDLLVLRGAWLESHGRHPKSLLRNDGTGRFTDVTFAVGLGEVHYPTQTAAWADFDHDGDLDLYVGNEGFPSQLFENDGQGNFRDIAAQAGVRGGGPTKAVAWGDYDGDGWPDLYVSNLGSANHLFHNQGNGTFVDRAAELGVAGPTYSFPIWFWDADNDGRLDLYVSSYRPGIEHVLRDYLGQPESTEPDAFYFGTADGRFEDRREALGFQRVTQPMGVNTGDIDNDGFLDFYIGTGYVDYEGLIPNLLFRNEDGKRLQDITFSARVGHLQKGHGIALADFDHDGDLDIFAVMGGWFTGDAFARAVFTNPGSSSNWLFVQLRGTTSNRFGVGSRLRASIIAPDGGRRDIYRWMDSGGSFGANPLRVHFGLSDSEQVEELEVWWPTSGKRQLFSGIAANQFIEIQEDAEAPRSLPY